ncbi:Ubiquitin--protein ligase [Handroanthus impetiginosus]|uniref:U-box domain-containing protein n=1 Tax=Handroanthus impetiginosus TaxID=429701 RepID=A0A2G9I3C7_9LAMI|nr:Ubiquitin--protein ligase [Handroanthus impetiginosus]
MIIPPLFRCPISLDLFEDPVTLSTGQTYERSCIEKWLAQGSLTCPVTMQKLQDPSMVPNHTLRHLIGEWLHSNTQMDGDDSVELTKKNDISIAEMKHIIESDEPTLESKLQLDFFGLLLELIFKGQENLIFVEKALFCAVKLMPFSDLGSLNLLKQDPKYEVFVVLFEKGSILIKKSLCLLIEAISSSLETRELIKKLGKADKLIQELIQLLQLKTEGVEAGIKAIFALSLIEQNRENLAKAGAVEGLIEYLSNAHISKKSLAPMAMCTIEKLLSVETTKNVIMNHAYGVKSIVKMVFRVSDHEGSESALNALFIICSESKSGREKAIMDGVLTQLLLLLQSQCNGRIKSKARMLLKLLRLMWDEDPSKNL